MPGSPVDAVTTDNLILIGFLSRYPANSSCPGRRFTSGPYDIGLRKGDTAFRTWLNDLLERIVADDRYQQAVRVAAC